MRPPEEEADHARIISFLTIAMAILTVAVFLLISSGCRAQLEGPQRLCEPPGATLARGPACVVRGHPDGPCDARACETGLECRTDAFGFGSVCTFEHQPPVPCEDERDCRDGQICEMASVTQAACFWPD